MNGVRGLLMRVGIDQTFGNYNAPINPNTGDYMYMPIPQGSQTFCEGMHTSYDTMIDDFAMWSDRNEADLEFPGDLKGKNCHLDPDFSYSSYGDQASGRGLRVGSLKRGDFLAFFASFRPTLPCAHKLIYAIFGILVVENVLRVSEVDKADLHKNAHTRILHSNENHLVVFGDQTMSGRFDRAISIGEYREGSYRVRQSVLDEWGGLEVKNGFIQRSVNPPWFSNSHKFMEWMTSQNVRLIQSNW